MTRRAALVLAAAVALASGGCSKSACQELGEKLCMCQPGATEDSCRTQVQDQLNGLGVGTPGFSGILDHLQSSEPITFEDFCQQRLDACSGRAEELGADFCEFLLTEEGKNLCGLTPETPAP